MNRIVVSLIVIFLVLVSAAATLNYFYQPGAEIVSSGSQFQPKNTAPVIKILSSGMVLMYVNGEISKIEGNKITITEKQNSITISTKESTPVSMAPAPGQKKPAQTGPIKVSELKKGDSVFANFKMLSDNSFEAISITITPLAPAPATKK